MSKEQNFDKSVKKFDCVEMKREIQEIDYQETKDMTREEKYAFWKEQEADFFKRNPVQQAS